MGSGPLLFLQETQETELGKKLITQGGWTLQESRVDFASLCTVVPWDLHSQNQNSKTKLLRSSRIVPWRIYWFLVLHCSRGGTSRGLFWLAAWSWPLAGISASVLRRLDPLKGRFIWLSVSMVTGFSSLEIQAES